jgi:hypothetical protein
MNDDLDIDDEEAGYPLDEAVEQIMQTSMLPDDAAEAIKDCIAGAGAGWFDGWIVAWWMESPMPIEALGFMGNTVPSATGWNAIFVADKDGLGPVVIDAADQASVCTVIDVAECF